MAIILSTIKDAVKDVTDAYVDTYDIIDLDTINEIKKILKRHFCRLREEINIIIETNYVDRMYRDIYYHYISTKLDSYPRNCIRISLFDVKVTEDLFYDYDTTEKVRKEKNYLGFYVLRPTFPQIIGRNVISPGALLKEHNNFKTCTTCFSMTAAGVKFDVVGFPHTSQDGEMICCADVTIWAIMEYFGNKYPEYSIVSPSKTMSFIRSISFERQLPTKGLYIESISYALRELGLGPKIYSRDVYKKDFDKLFGCYIESGIPIAVAIENYSKVSRPDNNHALVCTGHVIEDFENCRKIIEEDFKEEKHNGKTIKIFDWIQSKKSLFSWTIIYLFITKQHFQNLLIIMQELKLAILLPHYIQRYI
ncbi:MAG: hypothetical protein LBR10_12455 [Prevotellaceae bacterium]|jgi:hypothetical protein|nr:hypothetical protein [Prevotellaceae bacterium]